MGAPKAWLPFGVEPMLQRVARILSEVLSPMIVVAADQQELPRLPRAVKIVRDSQPDRGPLQAIADGLSALDEDVSIAFIAGCDAPLLSVAFVQRMLNLLAAAPDKQIAVAQVDGQFHPLAAAYRPSALGYIEAMLAGSRLKVTELMAEAPTRIVAADELRDIDPDLRSLRNVNTPDELSEAEKLTKG